MSAVHYLPSLNVALQKVWPKDRFRAYLKGDDILITDGNDSRLVPFSPNSLAQDVDRAVKDLKGLAP